MNTSLDLNSHKNISIINEFMARSDQSTEVRIGSFTLVGI